jgi:glutaredoxin
MSEYAYTTGSQFPPLAEGLVRLYSMRFCPYSQRVRLVLAAKNVKHETVNINTKRKPEWYLEINPMGTVPCLQYKDDQLITDSLIICEYLVIWKNKFNISVDECLYLKFKIIGRNLSARKQTLSIGCLCKSQKPNVD